MTTRACTSTKSIDGGSCSERVPCDGAIVMVRGIPTMIGGCGEPCSFVMERPGEREVAFRAGYRAGYDDCFGPGAEEGATNAWANFNSGEKR